MEAEGAASTPGTKADLARAILDQARTGESMKYEPEWPPRDLDEDD